MPKVLTTSSEVECVDKATVKLSAGQQKLKVAGNAVLVMGDLVGASVSGCPITVKPPPPGPVTKPCKKTLSMLKGEASKLKVDGKPVLLATAQGLTDGLGPAPGTWSVKSAGHSKLETS